MLNRLFIDNNDAFATYGLYIRDGGLAPLLAWPQFKHVATNNWYEMDGIEADLGNPVLSGRTLNLQLNAGHRDAASLSRELMADLMDGVYHTFYLPGIGRSFSLRYVNNTAFTMNEAFDTMTLALAEDSIAKPALGDTVTLHIGVGNTQTFTVAVPGESSVHLSGYLLDGIDFSRFGMMVTKGTLDQFQKGAKVKEALRRDIRTSAGIIYDGTGTVYTQPQDVTVSVHLRSSSMLDFWKMWYALFAVLLSSGEHVIEGAGRRLVFYYKSMNVQKFYPLANGGAWCDFSLSLSVLRHTPIQLLGTLENGTLMAIIDSNNVVISI